MECLKEEHEALPPSPPVASQYLLPSFKIKNLPGAWGKEEGCSISNDAPKSSSAATIGKPCCWRSMFKTKKKPKSNDERPPHASDQAAVCNDSTTVETTIENCNGSQIRSSRCQRQHHLGINRDTTHSCSQHSQLPTHDNATNSPSARRLPFVLRCDTTQRKAIKNWEQLLPFERN